MEERLRICSYSPLDQRTIEEFLDENIKYFDLSRNLNNDDIKASFQIVYSNRFV